MGRSSPDVSH